MDVDFSLNILFLKDKRQNAVTAYIPDKKLLVLSKHKPLLFLAFKRLIFVIQAIETKGLF